MKGIAAVLVVIGALGWGCASAEADFGVGEFSVSFRDAAGGIATQAGAHPYSMETRIGLVSHEEGLNVVPDQELRSLRITLPVGFVGDATAIPRCSLVQFKTKDLEDGHEAATSCPDSTAVGVANASVFGAGPQKGALAAIYNLEPEPGYVAALGFRVTVVPVVIELRVDPRAPNELIASVSNLLQSGLTASLLQVWGEPSDPSHDPYRGRCLETNGAFAPGELGSIGDCPTSATPPFLTMPRSCAGPGAAAYTAVSWQGATAAGSTETPAPTGCNRLGLQVSADAQPTTRSAGSSSGLAFALGVEDPGLTSSGALAGADVDDIAVTFPEGFVVDPSVADGLAACSEEQLASETPEGPPGSGCPEAAKIGSVEVQTPLLAEPLGGSIYIATPYRNLAGNSLLAAYVVIKNAALGVLIAQPVRISADPTTGRLVAASESLPQLPFSRFRLNFRGGERGPLTTPPGCGAYRTAALLTPSSGGPTVADESTFEITVGAAGGACPAGSPPLTPGFEAGTVTPLAGSYSPFVLKLDRPAGSAQLRSLETALPAGVLAKLKGVTECGDAAIASAQARDRPEAGRAELTAPSCPAASEIGSVTVGAGSGSPTLVSGRAYLAGPYKGAPLSLLVVTPAVAGPFDLGAVVVRNALRVDPFTARVTAVSDPLPSILQGIPLDLRSIDIYVDRPQFTLNPTSCDPTAVNGSVAALTGQIGTLLDRFQVGGCGGLGFAPKLALSLIGPTGRSGHPALKAAVSFPDAGGTANIARAQVSLPHSEFLDQGNLDKVCRQADLLAGTCPERSIYGHATAWSPLLDKPLRGPVYLGVGFGYKLPALVADLNGQIRVLLKGKIDTGRAGGIRTTFASVPDAPITRFVLTMKGGRKYGLLENSVDICARPQRLDARFDAQNGKEKALRTRISRSCGHAKGKAAGRD